MATFFPQVNYYQLLSNVIKLSVKSILEKDTDLNTTYQ